jgi:hypothetical protein
MPAADVDRPLRSCAAHGPLAVQDIAADLAADRAASGAHACFCVPAPRFYLCCCREFAMFGIGQHCCPNLMAATPHSIRRGGHPPVGEGASDGGEKAATGRKRH